MLEEMIAKSTSSGLSKIMQSLGLGGALMTGTLGAGANTPDGTASNPVHVIVANSGTGSLPGGTGTSAPGVVDAASSYGLGGLAGSNAGSQIAQSAVSNATTDGILGVMIGSAGTQSVSSALAQASANAASGGGGGGAPSGTGSSAILFGTGGLDISQADQDAAWGELASSPSTPGTIGGLGSLGTIGTGSLSSITGASNTSWQSLLGAGLSGLMTGASLGSLLTWGNGQNDSQVGSMAGGALGSIAGMMLGGPVGSAIGGVAGSLLGNVIGSLFGSHETAADQPDLNNPSYAQNVTNWNGGSGMFGGTQYLPSAQYNTGNGGISESADISSWVQSVSGNVAALTPAQQQLYNQIVSQVMGGNPDQTDIGIANEKNGVITFGDGSKMSVTQFDQLVANYQADVGSGPGQSPVFTIGRSYPNMNIGTLSQTGTYTPETLTVNNGTASLTSGGYTPTPGSTSPGSPAATPPVNNGTGTTTLPPGSVHAQSAATSGGVTVNVSGSVIGGTPQQIAAALAVQIQPYLRRIQDSIVPGNPNAWGSQTRYAGTG
jgi:hypothetical protein